MKYRFYSDAVIEQAKALQAQGKSYVKIAALLGVSTMGIRRRLDEQYRKRRNQSAANQRARDYKSTGANTQVHNRVIPDDVLAERERVSRAAISLTASLLGDPLPGRSALDRKRQQPLTLVEIRKR